MTAILKEDPPELVSGTRADLSPALDRIVRHCLEKNPAERFQTARDVAFALEALSGTSLSRGVGGDPGGAGACPLASRRWRWQSSQSRRLRPACSPIARSVRHRRRVAVRDQDVGLGVDHERALLHRTVRRSSSARRDRQRPAAVRHPAGYGRRRSRSASRGDASAVGLVEGRAGRPHRTPARSAIGSSAARSRG